MPSMSDKKVDKSSSATRQIKSRRRVVEHGEVFTNEREVKAMCDLVKDETNRIDSRFLEPACGNGNFLTEILRRKLDVVRRKYGKNQSEYISYSLLALSSIYGVELLEDNVVECRERLYKIWNKRYTAKLKSDTCDTDRSAAKHILKKNILCGDALTMRQQNGEPIIFAEWTMVGGGKIKRRDYTLADLLEAEKKFGDQLSLKLSDWDYDSKADSFIPKPISNYPLVNIREVANYA